MLFYALGNSGVYKISIFMVTILFIGFLFPYYLHTLEFRKLSIIIVAVQVGILILAYVPIVYAFLKSETKVYSEHAVGIEPSETIKLDTKISGKFGNIFPYILFVGFVILSGSKVLENGVDSYTRADFLKTFIFLILVLIIYYWINYKIPIKYALSDRGLTLIYKKKVITIPYLEITKVSVITTESLDMGRIIKILTNGKVLTRIYEKRLSDQQQFNDVLNKIEKLSKHYAFEIEHITQKGIISVSGK